MNEKNEPSNDNIDPPNIESCRGWIDPKECNNNNEDTFWSKKASNDIQEGHPGIFAQPCEEIIPHKFKRFYQTKSYEFTVFKDEKLDKSFLGIKVINYHAGELKLSFDILEEIIKYFKEDT